MSINKPEGWLSRFEEPTITLNVQMVDEGGKLSDEHLELKLKVTQDILDAVNEAFAKRNG